jgi:hypothetical protein
VTPDFDEKRLREECEYIVDPEHDHWENPRIGDVMKRHANAVLSLLDEREKTWLPLLEATSILNTIRDTLESDPDLSDITQYTNEIYEACAAIKAARREVQDVGSELCVACLTRFEATRADIHPTTSWGNVYLCRKCHSQLCEEQHGSRE